MSNLNPLARELNIKVVYYGPGLSGKTTSLKNLYSVLKPESRGELISLATEGDRTLFFDFLPIHLERVNDLTIRLQLYTVPGQIFYDATRKLVLNGADGVVFVADSQRAALDANLESMENLKINLGELGIDLDRFPMVLQYNKRDLTTALPVSTLRSALNQRSSADFETVADKGQGVYPAFKELVRQALADVRAKQRRSPAKGGGAREGAGDTPEVTLTNFTVPPELRNNHKIPLPATKSPLTFAPLVPSLATSVREIEQLIQEKKCGAAVQAAAARLAAILGDLPSTDTPAAKAALVGLDGREYLRLCRLAGMPHEALFEVDALFALHILLGAGLKADRI